jgi:hypothetical protein
MHPPTWSLVLEDGHASRLKVRVRSRAPGLLDPLKGMPILFDASERRSSS